MSEPISSSMHVEYPVDIWSFSESFSVFFRIIRQLTTKSHLSLAQILYELRQRSTADGIFLFSRGANPNGNLDLRRTKPYNNG